MKKLLGICALITVVAVFFTACPLLEDKLSARDCIEPFIEEANAENWSNLKDYTHPDATQYGQANADFWETRLSAEIPLTLNIVSNGIANFTGNNNYTATIIEDESDDYRILDIRRTVGSHYIFE